MIESITVTHHIQKYIIDVLMYKEFARFSELRPPRTDTNLFAYHLKLLQKAHIIDKTENGYTLTGDGLSYVDRVSTEKKIIRTQPKIITMLLVQNSNGDLLLQKRDKQPYINSWTLPYGKLHIEDATLEAAARREASDKLGFTPDNIRHAGDCYIRVTSNGELLSTTLAHVFRFEHDDIVARDDLQWVRPHKLNQYKLAPAVEAIVARSFFNDQFFFEEFDTVW
jgi:ADP-ribose pyrophosphatase YjhB (NUDIX family)